MAREGRTSVTIPSPRSSAELFRGSSFPCRRRASSTRLSFTTEQPEELSRGNFHRLIFDLEITGRVPIASVHLINGNVGRDKRRGKTRVCIPREIQRSKKISRFLLFCRTWFYNQSKDRFRWEGSMLMSVLTQNFKGRIFMKI